MNRGEVRWFTFARPDKRRPVVILTRTPALPYLSEITVATITSTVRDVPSQVLLSVVDGMPRDCVVNLDRIVTVSRGKVGPLVTTLSVSKMVEIEKAIQYALGFSHGALPEE
jgi:mRNA interferase MazF